MKIELSKEQYQCLVRLVMAGNWLINSHRAGDEILEEYEEMEQYILSLAKQFDAEDIVQCFEDDSKYYAVSGLEEEIMEFSTEYDNNVFWDELISRMALKEAVKKYKNPTTEQVWKLEDDYSNEFAIHGINRLEVRLKEDD